MGNINEYIKRNTHLYSDHQLEMENYAEEHHVPIIARDSLDLVLFLIKQNKPTGVLEFGSAIGYSSIMMANAMDGGSIITIERNEERYNQAKKNVSIAKLENKIEILNIDALDAKNYLKGKIFDMVFIDAAKGQYMKFFDIVYELVVPGGLIISDNIFHKGMVCEEDELNVQRRQRTIYRRMNEYLYFLKNNEDRFFTTMIPIGDGIALTYKNERNNDE